MTLMPSFLAFQGFTVQSRSRLCRRTDSQQGMLLLSVPTSEQTLYKGHVYNNALSTWVFVQGHVLVMLYLSGGLVQGVSKR